MSILCAPMLPTPRGKSLCSVHLQDPAGREGRKSIHLVKKNLSKLGKSVKPETEPGARTVCCLTDKHSLKQRRFRSIHLCEQATQDAAVRPLAHLSGQMPLGPLLFLIKSPPRMPVRGEAIVPHGLGEMPRQHLGGVPPDCNLPQPQARSTQGPSCCSGTSGGPAVSNRELCWLLAQLHLQGRPQSCSVHNQGSQLSPSSQQLSLGGSCGLAPPCHAVVPHFLSRHRCSLTHHG